MGITIFIEDTILGNFLLCYFSFEIMFLFIGEQKSKLKISIASLFYSFFSLVYPVLKLQGITKLILYLFVIYITVLFSYKTDKIKRHMFIFVMFLLISSIYIGINKVVSSYIFNNKEMPLYLLIILLYFATFFIKQCQKMLIKRRRIKQFTYSVEVFDDDKKFTTIAYLDSGNVLKENDRNVVICNFNFIVKLYKNFTYLDYFKNNISLLKNGHFLEVKTATGASKFIAFSIDKFVINKREYTDVIVAVSKYKISSFGCDLILNSNMFGG